MTPNIRFHTYVITGTTFLIFYSWTFINKIEFIDDTLKLVIGFGTSFGFYRIIINLALLLTKKISFVKKHILGSSYLEGTWVGFYIGFEDKPRFFVERFEQEMTHW